MGPDLDQLMGEFDVYTCCLCSGLFMGWGNNPEPLGDYTKGDRCCDTCNDTRVIPARIYRIKGK